jgi:hypothetical protein
MFCFICLLCLFLFLIKSVHEILWKIGEENKQQCLLISYTNGCAFLIYILLFFHNYFRGNVDAQGHAKIAHNFLSSHVPVTLAIVGMAGAARTTRLYRIRSLEK